MRTRSIIILVLSVVTFVNIPGGATPPGVVAQSSAPTWVKTSATVPDGFTSMVYDSVRQRTVGFAYNYDAKQVELWEYDSRSWSKKTTVVASRNTASSKNAVYDSKRNRIVMFGFVDVSNPDYKQWKNLSETWEYDGSTWSKKNTTISPTFRSNFSMVYDANRDRTVLFGGNTGDPDYKALADTWEYDGTTWIKQNPSTSPPPRSGSAMTYDSTRKLVVLFGGMGEGCCPPNVFSDTWEYDGTRWVQKSVTSAPPSRTEAALAFDKGRARTVLFGGGKPNPTLSDTWEYDGANWTEIKSSSSPADRSQSGFVYDEARNRIVLAGGGYLCQTIEECNKQQPLFSANSAQVRGGLRYFSVNATHKSNLLLGGGGPRYDTWEYSTQGGSPRLEITKVEFIPNPLRTFQREDIKLTIENKGTAAYSPIWNYTGRVTLSGGGSTREIDFDEGHDSVLLLENPQDPFRVNQKWVLTIHASFWDAVTNGRLQITVQPKGLGSSTPSLPALQVTQTVSVSENLDAFGKCSVAVAKTFAGALGPVGKCVLNAYASAGAAVQCKDKLCQAGAFGAGLAKCAVKPASIVSGIKATFDSKELESRAKDCFSIVQWAGDLVRNLIGRGININFFGVHSPATLLITDQAGRRTGILDNGSIVQEIPDSWVVIDGEEKYVVYQGTSPVTMRVKGTGTGTMRLEMTTSDGKDGGRSVTYDAVPVNPNMVAQVVTTDGQASLSIDSNGDGQVDQSKKPDTMATVAPVGRSFSETGKSVSGKFWTAWQGERSYEGSLYINGLPLTERRPELNPTDGKTYDTQWFERARFEYHPENQPPNDVLLGLMGVRATQGRQGEAPFKSVPNPGNGTDWFSQTGHTLGDSSEGGQAIAWFWRRLGGLTQFGYPLSQPFTETNKENGKQYLVQYFERQRFEYHAENKGTQYEVLLGRLGAEQMGK